MNIGELKNVLSRSISGYDEFNENDFVNFIFNPIQITCDDMVIDKHLNLVIKTQNKECCTKSCLKDSDILDRLDVYLTKNYCLHQFDAYLQTSELLRREEILIDFIIGNSIHYNNGALIFEFPVSNENTDNYKTVFILTNVIEGEVRDDFYYYDYLKPNEYIKLNKIDAENNRMFVEKIISIKSFSIYFYIDESVKNYMTLTSETTSLNDKYFTHHIVSK
ncbi:hypothetical protein [Fusibacter sp. 3D3]|uniref:hypothetical protein n=1 Tax=Fusibacter sp. 3D3 TaxID=1048380 RepID=UPI0008536BCF|nr:hypothetical protein [Fusibacter sp. 3D3]GAU79208.1 hypothetical protein F3D3_3866 [Fusibacter sp. 3D3]